MTSLQNRVCGTCHPEFRSLPRLRNSPSRAAFTVVELVLSLGLLVVFFAMFVPLLGMISRERRMSAQEQAALQHAANVLDDLTRHSYDELSTPASSPLPDHVRQLLSEAEQTVMVTPAAGEPAAKQVTVTLRWKQAGGTWSHPVSLSAWVHAKEGGAP